MTVAHRFGARIIAGPAGSGLLLGLFAFATASLLALSDAATRGPIAERAAEDLRASLGQVLTAPHDNDPAASTRSVTDAEEGEVTVYVARENGAATGLDFQLGGQGYSGEIGVIIGILPDGSLSGVRVLSHTETPGLGDKIEAAKSDWVEDFTGRSLTDPAEDDWKIRRDGGVFDQFSGASITPRAVVATVRRGLLFFERNRAALLAPAEGDS